MSLRQASPPPVRREKEPARILVVVGDPHPGRGTYAN